MTPNMKRSRNPEGSSPGDFIIYEDDFGAPLERHPPSGLLTPPQECTRRPSKLRRHGSKIMSVLRSLTNSGKGSIVKPKNTLRQAHAHYNL
jgi:hypothetical protein